MADWLAAQVEKQKIQTAIQNGEEAQRRTDNRMKKLLDILVERKVIDAADRKAIARIVA